MAKFEIQIVGNNENLKAALKDSKNALNEFANLGIDPKPLTAYQSELLKIKKELLDISKAKEADRQSQIALNAEIKNQKKLQKEANDEASKKRKEGPLPGDAADSVKKITAAYNGLIVTQDRSVKNDNLAVNSMNAKYVAYAKLTTEMGKQAAAQSSLTPVILGTVAATKESTKADTESNGVKAKGALIIAEEKAQQAKATAELKNHVRETNAAKGSLEQRQAALVRLTAVQKNLTVAERESAAGTRLASIISGLKSQIKSINDTSTPTDSKGVFDYIKTSALSALGPIALLTAAIAGAKEIFSHNLEISDSLADVQRTAKLSQEEVGGLSKELQKLPTRTDLSGLLDIGFIGGRLSVPKEQLKDFIQQVDELGVVLKKEFPGGAEAIAESLGKIVTVYKITTKEGVTFGQALTKVGSNFLDLAHSGPVTVKYLQDFTLGIAGTAATAKLSLPVIAAYGAVLGESGQIASSASLAVTRLVNDLSVKRDKYFAIAQLGDATLTIDKFTKLINTDTQAALTLFFKGLKAGNPVATELGDRLASVGIKTGKVSNAVKILAENQDKLNDRIQKGTKSYDDATAIAHNFEIANNTLGASTNKLSNAFVNLTTNPNGNVGKFLKGIVDNATLAITALSDLSDLLDKTQAEQDRATIKKYSSLSNGKQAKNLNGDVIDNGLTPEQKKELSDAIDRNNARAAKFLQNRIADEGFAKADQLAAGKSEVQIRKLLVSEINKETIARDRLASALKFLNDPKNSDAQVKVVSGNINTLRANSRRQNGLVKRLKSKLPGNTEVIGDGSLVDPDAKDRTIPVIRAELKSLQDANTKLDTQSALFKANIVKIRRLKEELRLALGGKEKSAPAAPRDFKEDIKDVTTRATNYESLSGLEDIDKTNEKTKQKYQALNDDLDKIQKAYNAKYVAGSQQRIEFDSQLAIARQLISDNSAKEISQNEIDFNKKKADIIAGIEEDAGVIREVGYQREIELSDNHYKELARQYANNADILAQITQSKEDARFKIGEKYTQKRIDEEEDLTSKIQDLADKDFISNDNFSRKTTQKNKDALQERLKDVTDYFDKLKKLNVNGDLGSIVLGVTESGIKKNITEKKDEAEKGDSKKVISDLAGEFGSRFLQTLSSINEQADRTFSGVITSLSESLTTMLNDVFSTQLSQILKNLVDGTKINTTQALSAIAGVAGSLISGLTSKTSSVGQAAGGALTGAGSGALIGSGFGPTGTVIGAIAGGLVGAIGGLFGASKARKQQEELQRQQLEEAKKQTELLRQNALTYTSAITGRMTDQGILTNVDIGAMGELKATVSGKQIDFILARNNNSRG